jgi:hypothetical protein
MLRKACKGRKELAAMVPNFRRFLRHLPSNPLITVGQRNVCYSDSLATAHSVVRVGRSSRELEPICVAEFRFSGVLSRKLTVEGDLSRTVFLKMSVHETKLKNPEACGCQFLHISFRNH